MLRCARNDEWIKLCACRPVRLAETPPHPEFAHANSGLSPQAGRGERNATAYLP
ncbi:hypothetical protein GWG65_07395 [Bradyrhizobium sp. CSA207]|nr:hypothetical protein [Bradyrhizobium sp. CSA207]